MRAYLRSREELADVMEGWNLMESGLVRPGYWRPEDREDKENCRRTTSSGGLQLEDWGESVAAVCALAA